MMWEQLGFQKSPYFWEELTVSEQGFTLFVGRQEEGKRFLVNLSEPEGCTVIVEGDRGIGKTSFINYNQYVLYKEIELAYPDLKFRRPHLLPSLRKIQLKNGEPVESIYLKILSGCIFSIQNVCKDRKQKFPERLNDIRDYVTQVISHTVNGGLGVSVLGSGMNFNRGTSQSISDTTQFREMTFLEFLDQLADVVRSELGFDGIFISINNIDTLSLDYLTHTLDYLRDSLFCRRYYWWALITPIGLHSFIRQNISRLAGVISGKPIQLAPLPPEDIESLLEARMSYLSLTDPPPPPPISKRIMLFLYEKSNGDIRFAFQVANEVVKRVFYDYPSITQIDEELAAREIARITLDEIRMSKFNSAETKIIGEIIRNPKIKEIAAHQPSIFKIPNSKDFKDALDSLVQKKWLTQKSTPDQQLFYLPRGYTSLAQIFQLSEYPSVLPELSSGEE
jgi:hypothetical protein